MYETILSLGPWFWVILGCVLLIIETFAPGAFMLWLGLGALTNAAINFFWPDISLTQQWVNYALLAVISIGVGIIFSKKIAATEPASTPSRLDKLKGKTFALHTAIQNGTGTIKTGDSVWTVTGPDLAKNTRVRVINVVGTEIEVTSETQSTQHEA